MSREDYDAAKLIKDQLAAARQAAGVPPPPKEGASAREGGRGMSAAHAAVAEMAP